MSMVIATPYTICWLMSLYRRGTITIHVVRRGLGAQGDEDATIRTRRPRLTIVMYGLLLYLFKLGISVNKRTKRLIRRSLKRRGDHRVGEEAVHFLLGTHDHRDPTL
jgi:hypothetical protein